MTLEKASQLVKACMEEMNTLYRRIVFNEWAILSRSEHRDLVLAYEGPRTEYVQKGFVGDMRDLISDMSSGEHAPGDFVFAHEAEGTQFDAFIVLGEGIFLICNNTEKIMDEITGDPLWRKAQAPFANLSYRFQTDQVELKA